MIRFTVRDDPDFRHSCTNSCTPAGFPIVWHTKRCTDAADKHFFMRESCRSASRVVHRRVADRELSVAGGLANEKADGNRFPNPTGLPRVLGRKFCQGGTNCQKSARNRRLKCPYLPTSQTSSLCAPSHGEPEAVHRVVTQIQLQFTGRLFCQSTVRLLQLDVRQFARPDIGERRVLDQRSQFH